MLTNEQREKAGVLTRCFEQMLDGKEQALAPVHFGKELISNGIPFRTAWIESKGYRLYIGEVQARRQVEAQHILGIAQPLKSKRIVNISGLQATAQALPNKGGRHTARRKFTAKRETAYMQYQHLRNNGVDFSTGGKKWFPIYETALGIDPALESGDTRQRQKIRRQFNREYQRYQKKVG
jgi:hypothetical protein